MPGEPPATNGNPPPANGAAATNSPCARAMPEEMRDESVTAVYFAAGRDHAPDGRHSAGGLRGLPPASRFRSSAGRLPHHSGADVLSRRQPGRDGLLGHRAARAPVRPDSRPEPDDLDELLRQLHHHSAIRSGPEHRHRRTGSASRHQWRVQSSCRRAFRIRRSTARSIPPTRRS